MTEPEVVEVWLTVEQLDVIADALFGKPVAQPLAHSIQSVLWAARFSATEEAGAE